MGSLFASSAAVCQRSERPPHQRASERNLVSVFRQGPRVRDRRLGSSRCQFWRQPLSLEQARGLRSVQRDGRYAAEHEPRASADVAFHVDHDCRTCEGVSPRLTVENLLVRAAPVRGRSGKDDLGEDLIAGQDVLAGRVVSGGTRRNRGQPRRVRHQGLRS